MEKAIPDIAFLKRNSAQLEFEIFTLQSLFSRQYKIDHPIDQPHRVEFYNIIYITQGTGAHTIDFIPYRFSPQSLIFVSKGQVHAFDLRSNIDGFVVLFTDAFLSTNLIHADILSFYRLYNYHLHEPVIHPEEAPGEVFRNTVDEMYREYQLSDDFAKAEILRLLLKLLLLRAERIKRTLVPKEKNTGWFTTFNAFKALLETHFATTRDAAAYAKSMNISYKHLNEVCKSITGITAKAFIDQFIILEAKRRLATSNPSLKELTYALGFDEPTNFSKFFKKHTGEPPSQFKKKTAQ